MTISVIIPVYQVENYIVRCLESVICQSCKDFEIILVDDASQDNSMALARKVLENVDIPVSYITHKENKGLSAARNSGIKVARGEYLLFLDSDDALEAGAIETFVKHIKEINADCFVGNYRVVSETGEYVSKRYSQEKLYDSASAIRKAYGDGDIPIMAWNKCVKNVVVREKGLYFKDNIYHEDELWTFFLINEVSTLSLIGVPTYTYYIRGGSIMTHVKSESKLFSGIIIYQEMVDYMEKRRLTDDNLKESVDRFAFQRYRDIFRMSENGGSCKILYHKMREAQKRAGRCWSKWGIMIGLHLLFPEFLGYFFMKLQIKVNAYRG